MTKPIPKCKGCGKCCEYGWNIPVLPSDALYGTLYVEKTFEGARMRRVPGTGHCVAYNPTSKTCGEYERRPQVCRDFERGDVQCKIALKILDPWGRPSRTTS